MRPVWVIDTETTDLTPDYDGGTGTIWELGLIEYGSPDRRERLWRLRPDLAKADEEALAVGKFYERTGKMMDAADYDPAVFDLAGRADGFGYWSAPGPLAHDVARLLDGTILVAANPAFDAGYLRAFLRHYGQAATWSYRLRDIGSMAWAWLLGQQRVTPAIDASTDVFAEALGIDPAGFERHSALGDCRLAGAMLDAITGGQA